MSERRNQRETTENGQNYTPENQQGAPNGQNYGPYGQPNQGNPYGGQNGYQQGPYSQNRQNYGPNQNRQGRPQGGPGYNQNRGQAGPGYGQQRQQGAYRGQGGPSPYYQNRQGAPYPGQRPPKKKKKGHRKLFFVLEVLVLMILAGGLYVFSRLNKMQQVNIKPGDVIVNKEVQEKEPEVANSYTNIALYGVDSREGQLTIDAHSDALMVASINDKTKDVKLVSVYRDTYLDNTNGEYRKATECYFYGGPTRSISMLNKNLDLDIQDYVTVDFNVVADVVDAIGGVEIDVQQDEIKWLNGYQTEGSQVTGKEIVEVTQAGPQTLNGLQTLSYCRIRYTTGDDYKRTERQRTVLNKILEKVKTMPVTTLVGIVNDMFDHISTSLTLPEIIDLAKDVAAYNLVDTTGFPFNSTPMTLPTGGDCVVPVNLANNVLQLHQWMYGSDSYDAVSSTVQEISDHIINETGAQ
ncbi:LCP family protein [Lachnospiraceae bacterium Marseille-Q4251]|uniref:LCP family protein n=1 Tax=Fusicatenibacter faecihominis TaxID=2881276 RepID=A0AAE3DQE5_9FIRM|nr:LCP family protein [Fusicatenibacter faecihominis]MBR9939610.1 LCP family protein [Lachnospiraceae bacterium Marseille-Q4251]MCC2188677.1 LCP family protein [Fusicatenibacter faecihominis]